MIMAIWSQYGRRKNMRTLIIEGDNIDDVRKDVYNFLLGGKYREVVAVKQIKPNYVHVIYVPESKLVS